MKVKSIFFRIKLLVFSLLIIFSCVKIDDIKSPIEGFKILIDYNIFDTFISFRFVDAATGNLIGSKDDEKVRLSISGKSADAIVDQMGNREKFYDSVFGLLSLALNPKDPWKPSSENALEIQLEATNQNYKTATQKLKIDSVGKYEFKFLMERKDVESSGIKTYSFQLILNKQGELLEDFIFSSTGNEMKILIKKGTTFLNANNETELKSPVNLVLKVYTKTSAVPYGSNLITDLVSTSEVKTKVALDLYRAVDMQFKNNELKELTNPSKHPIILRQKIEANSYNPLTKKAIADGNLIHLYSYQTKFQSWQNYSETKLLADSLGFYVQTEIKSFGINASGMHLDLCNIDVDYVFNLKGDFPEYPVPSMIYFYRKFDSRYIGYTRIDIPKTGFNQAVSFKVPENTPVRAYLRDYTSANSFISQPDNFSFEAGCGKFGKFESQISTTSTKISGKVKVKILKDFPDDEFFVNALIYNSTTNGLLWSKQYKISKTLGEFEITADLPANIKSHIRIQSVKAENSFISVPDNIIFNTSAAQNLVWDFSITPLFTLMNLNFNFTRNANMPATDFRVKAEITNMETQKVESTVIFTVKPGKTNYIGQAFLSTEKRYKINLKRVEGADSFIAYPYEYIIGYLTKKDYLFESELSKVVVKNVTLTAKVVCPKSEIIPTLHGYYRTVYEDQWKEADIVKGILKIDVETNSTYIIGIIVNGKMETSTYKIEENNVNFEFKLGDYECSQMGW